MVFNPFTRNLILRVALLFVTLVIWASIFLRKDLFFNQVLLFVLVLIQLISLVRYITRTNRELSRFLDSIRDNDFTAHFDQLSADPTFAQLNRSFGGLIARLNQQETEKNAQNLFLKALIEEIPFGILVMEDRGDLRLINEHAQSSLDLPDVQQWKKLRTDRTHLLHQLTNLPPDRSHLLEHIVEGHSQTLSVAITTISINRQPLRIISIKNIQTEIQRKETEAWHKLIRVLTHEIMNSITPITSITETLKAILKDRNELDNDTIEDIREAVDTVHSRSTGILTFVKKYRELSRIPPPQFDSVDILNLLKRVIRLMQNNYPEVAITLENTSLSEISTITCDEAQIEQVLINLIKNATEAYGDQKEDLTVLCSIIQDENDVVINIRDEGQGISEKQLERIFIPFYTTKRNGSGIGLGLSRQILQNHQGTLTCESRMSPTIFSVRLPIKLSS